MQKKSELVHGIPDCDQLGEQFFQQVEVQHIGAIAFGTGGVEVGFNKKPVHPSGNTRPCHGSYERGPAACNP